MRACIPTKNAIPTGSPLPVKPLRRLGLVGLVGIGSDENKRTVRGNRKNPNGLYRNIPTYPYIPTNRYQHARPSIACSFFAGPPQGVWACGVLDTAENAVWVPFQIELFVYVLIGLVSKLSPLVAVRK